MRSTRLGKPAGGVSLFPFLAVLICTMGAIIVLLLLVVQQARVQAAGIKREQAAEDPEEELREAQEREDFDWRREMLERQRGELVQKLAEERLELGHLEDHIRRLQDQWRRAVAQAEELNRSGKPRSADQEALAAEQSRLKEEIALAKAQLTEAKEKQSGKPRSFAIIPYKGPNGTHRRPIYIECRGDAIVFQPEGITLGPADFEGPLLPGNPFDAALRATREYLASAGAKEGGEPYPLLVVRPDGAVAFALARSAMKSWEDEFGYELIDQETKLAFPPPDSRLADTLSRALQDARRRQELLARMAPSRFKGIGTAGARGPGGGGTGLGFGEHFGAEFSETSAAPGGYAAAGGNSTGSGDGSPQTSGSANGKSSRTGRGSLDTASSLSGGGTAESGGVFYGGEAPQQKETGTIGKPLAAAGATPSSAPGSGRNYEHSGVTSRTPAGTAHAGAAGSSANAGNYAAADSSASAGGSDSGGRLGSEQGAPKITFGQDQEQTSSAGKSQAVEERKTRRRRSTPNWGLPNSSQNSVGFTRPIRIVCSADRLVVLPERGEGSAPRVVPVEQSASLPVDDFVDAVWKHMEAWGIAGKRAYWKPVLSVQVAPGGEARFDELRAQLEGSGLDVERK